MTMLTMEGPVQARSSAKPEARHTPQLTETPWGYIISQPAANKATCLLATLTGRIGGLLLLATAAGLWVAPDSMVGADVLGMKLAATLMFTIFGGYMVWAARAGLQPEVQIDIIRREVRRGHRNLRREFVEATRLSFHEIGSVYLLRSHEAGRMSRLLLRLGASDEALEIARGALLPLEHLRDRLAHELTPARISEHKALYKVPPFGQHVAA
jgi:hypothetical protein